MIVPEGMQLRLSPEDEYTHAPEAAQNYNESTYFNAFSQSNHLGLWLRLGNRVNEGHAELSCCIYLPNGQVGFIHARPSIDNNDAMNAGGMCVEVVSPFKHQRVSYEGEVLLLDQPLDMINPKAAFSDNPKVACTLQLDVKGVSPMHGGEIVNADGSAWQLDPETSVFRGHFEQHVAVQGSVIVDGIEYPMDGFGFRDKSWGPRHWQSFYYYKWLPITFNADFGFMLAYMGQENGSPIISGHVFDHGVLKPLTDAAVNPVYDGNDYQTGMTLTLATASKTYHVQGKVVSLIPLRHRRMLPDGSETVARITEAMTQYHCEGYSGLGMSEFLDLLTDGKPISVPAKA